MAPKSAPAAGSAEGVRAFARRRTQPAETIARSAGADKTTGRRYPTPRWTPSFGGVGYRQPCPGRMLARRSSRALAPRTRSPGGLDGPSDATRRIKRSGVGPCRPERLDRCAGSRRRRGRLHVGVPAALLRPRPHPRRGRARGSGPARRTRGLPGPARQPQGELERAGDDEPAGAGGQPLRRPRRAPRRSARRSPGGHLRDSERDRAAHRGSATGSGHPCIAAGLRCGGQARAALSQPLDLPRCRAGRFERRRENHLRAPSAWPGLDAHGHPAPEARRQP